MVIHFMDESERNEASSTFTSADESVLVNLVRSDFGLDENGIDIRLYSALVYAGYEWQRVDHPETRQRLYERREEGCLYDVPYAEARAHAERLAAGPSGI